MPLHYRQFANYHAVLVFLGLIAIAAIIINTAWVSLSSLTAVNQRLTGLVHENNVKLALINRLDNIVHERMLTLYSLMNATDAIEAEEVRARLYSHGSEFIRTRDVFLAMMPSSEEKTLLAEQRTIIQDSDTQLSQIFDLTQAGDLAAAKARVAPAIAHIRRVVENLAAIRVVREAMAEQSFQSTKAEYHDTRQQLITLNSLSLAGCLAIILWLSYKSTHQGQLLAKAAGQLEATNKNLENRVLERTRELIDARDEAIRASSAKSRFLANMSHELRTPLNAIIGYSEMLKEESEDLGHHYAVTDLNKILTAGQHLLQLVDDILNLAKIESGRMEITPSRFEVADLLQEVCTTVAPLVEQNRNRFVLEAAPEVSEMFADPMRVRQILYNLLSNAGKFTHEGVITLKVAHQLRDNTPWVCFIVKDTGIGISNVEKQKLFQLFSQVDNSSTRKYGGTGLGLVISLRFCQLMGGTIAVESDLGKGSMFSVWLPQYMLEH